MTTRVLIVTGSVSDEWARVKSYLSKRRRLLIYSASSLGEAFRVLRGEDISIAILDYALPRTKPLSLLRRVKKLRPHLEVIYLSEKISLSEAIMMMKEGAYDFYEFPVNPRLLMTVMEKAMEKQELVYELKELEQKVKQPYEFENIIGKSKPIRHVIGLAGSVARRNVNVLLEGETGTGKELIASAIHYHGPRSLKPFIKVNCAAFNEGVLESELFGHEKGAFTGAIAQRVGRFELADEGTIFLDEIGDISPSTQIKLLRVLQEREFERVGGNRTIKVDVRIIAATNKDLQALVREGRFREDLYYRLNVVNLRLPPLRDRKEDIPLLVSFFINRINEGKGYGIKGISREVMRILMDYNWPGNVRELENALESAMALSEGPMLDAKYLPSFMLLSPQNDGEFMRLPAGLSLREIELEAIRHALELNGYNKSRAAKMLGIGLRTLHRKVKEL